MDRMGFYPFTEWYSVYSSTASQVMNKQPSPGVWTWVSHSILCLFFFFFCGVVSRADLQLASFKLIPLSLNKIFLKKTLHQVFINGKLIIIFLTEWKLNF